MSLRYLLFGSYLPCWLVGHEWIRVLNSKPIGLFLQDVDVCARCQKLGLSEAK